MPTSKAIAPHLPYLRRFARALAGTQHAGDAYVAATLEVLIEDPALFDKALDPRAALYRTFVGLWNSLDVNLKPEGGSDSGATMKSVARNPLQMPALIRTGLDTAIAVSALRRACGLLGVFARLGGADLR